MLSWFTNCVMLSNTVNQTTKFAIIDTKLYVPVATLSSQDNKNY